MHRKQRKIIAIKKLLRTKLEKPARFIRGFFFAIIVKVAR